MKRFEKWSDIYGLCALNEDVVLLASSQNGLDTISLSSQLRSRLDHSGPEQVSQVAFDESTETLLLVAKARNSMLEMANQISLVSLRREANKWVKVDAFHIATYSLGDLQLVVCNSRVLLGHSGEEKLQAFNVTAEQSLRPFGTVLLHNRFRHFACTRITSFVPVSTATPAGQIQTDIYNIDTIIALSREKSVSLHRLVGIKLEPLAVIGLSDPQWLLFREDLLLVAERNIDSDTHTILSFIATGRQLTPHRQFLDSSSNVDLAVWCLVGDRLVVRNSKSKGLLIYDFQ